MKKSQEEAIRQPYGRLRGGGHQKNLAPEQVKDAEFDETEGIKELIYV